MFSITKKIYKKWTKEDKELIVKLYQQHEQNFKNYLSYFPDRTLQQIQSFYYNQVNKNKRTQQDNNNKHKIIGDFYGQIQQFQEPTEKIHNSVQFDQEDEYADHNLLKLYDTSNIDEQLILIHQILPIKKYQKQGSGICIFLLDLESESQKTETWPSPTLK
ncbi:SANT/Myb_domain [Hexamita inflata]|uniref:SANT/Myb domain n=1 Tax=Hexamita inflata TaxID=28002 RepID=A0AA86QDA9_9EUKA|nr:SANT/Myb domain [Hexamita inflata]